MSIEDIVTRAGNREGSMWSPFQHHFVGAIAVDHRSILFGLYSNRYKHGCAYLIEVSNEQLTQLVDQYEANISQLNAEEQKAVLDLATKRYLEILDQQIHDDQMDTERGKIDATDQEFDVKFEALESDRLAIETLQEKLSYAISKANTEIQVLEAKILQAEIDQQYVEVDISKAQLAAAKAELRVLEAGLKGLNLQLDIANAAVTESELELEKQKTQQSLDLVPGELTELEAQNTSLDADKLRTETGQSLIDSEIAELQIKILKTQLDAINRGIDTALLDVDIAKANLDIAMVDVDISETESRTAREEAKRIEYETDTAMVDVKVAQLQLDADKVQAQLKEIEADITRFEAQSLKKNIAVLDKQIVEVKLSNIEYEIPRKKNTQKTAIENQIDILKTKIAAVEIYQVIEDLEYISKDEQQQTEHEYKMAMANLDILYDLHKAAIKIESYSKDVTIATEQQDYQEQEDDERIRIPESRIASAIDIKRGAIDAAKIMASADIINSMTHTIGAA